MAFGRSCFGLGWRTWAADLILLLVLCLVVYFVGLTNHGLTNWQESQRALVVQEMHARGDWLVPTINNQPYLAKPPLFYWVQLSLNKLLGGTPGEFELRFAAALGGTLGVLCMYIVARRMARDWKRAPWSGLRDGCIGTDRDSERFARITGLWAGATLATGILYARSSRIGELDIWIVPFVIVAIGAVHAAWRTHIDRNRTNFVAVAIAIAAGIGAALAKGPPGVLTIVTGGFGAIALWAAYSQATEDVRSHSHVSSDRFAKLLGAAFALVVAFFTLVSVDRLAGGAVAFRARTDGSVIVLVGTLMLAAIAWFLGFTLGRLLQPSRGIACFRAFSRTHPVAVLGVPVLVLWGWGKLVAARIGPENAEAWAQKEAEDNLQVLVAISPIKNLEAASYGVGFASIFAIVGLVWLWRAKPPMTPAAWIAVAWIVLGFIGYSMLGKGIARYLTPTWPGFALLAGLMLASLTVEGARLWPRASRGVLSTLGHVRIWWIAATLVLGLTIGQSWWYGFGREAAVAERSPRSFIRELLEIGKPTLQNIAGAEPLAFNSKPIDPERIGTFEFWTAATSVYAGTRVHPVGDIFIRDKTAGGGRFTLETLRDSIRTSGPWTLIIRERQPNDAYWSSRPAIDRLHEAGFVVTPIELESKWSIDGSAMIPVHAVHIGLP